MKISINELRNIIKQIILEETNIPTKIIVQSTDKLKELFERELRIQNDAIIDKRDEMIRKVGFDKVKNDTRYNKTYDKVDMKLLNITITNYNDNIDVKGYISDSKVVLGLLNFDYGYSGTKPVMNFYLHVSTDENNSLRLTIEYGNAGDENYPNFLTYTILKSFNIGDADTEGYFKIINVQ